MKFQYSTKAGQQKTIDAANAAEAQRLVATLPDADPRSGVMEIRETTTDERDGRTLPDMEDVGSRDLPQDAEQPPGRIKNLTEALTLAVDAGRQKRNKLLQTVIGEKFGGTLRAGDFGSVLDSASAVSERTFDTIVGQYEKSLESNDPDIMTTTDDAGTVYGIDKNTGTVIWTKAGVGKADGTGGDTDYFSEADKRLLMQAGLAAASPEVQVGFLRGTPDEFKQDWIRNNAADGVDNSGTAFEALYNDLKAWEEMYKPSSGELREEDDEPLFSDG